MIVVGAMVMVSWGLCVAGAIAAFVSRRRFAKGDPMSAASGLILAERCCPVALNATTCGKGSFETRQTLCRWVGDGTVLFAPAQYYDPGRGLWRLEWFGCVRMSNDEALIEARIARGTLIFVSGWLLMFWTMAAFVFAVLSPMLGFVVAAVALIAMRGYRRSFDRERTVATEAIGEITRKLHISA
jgi:hypothetical protein